MFHSHFLILASYLVFLSSSVFCQLTANREGKVDRTFGSNGFSILTPTEGDFFSHSADSEVLPDGKIVTAYGTQRVGLLGITVARLLPNGQPDTSFGAKGQIVISGSVHHWAVDILPLPDGKLLVAGTVQTQAGQPGYSFLLLRLNSNGQLDSTFADGGFFKKSFALPGEKSQDRVSSIAIQMDGKIILGGVVNRFVDVQGRAQAHAAVMRLHPDGAVDATFGDGGASLVPIDSNLPNTWDAPKDADVLVHADSKITLGATSRRYFSPSPLDVTFFAHVLRFLPNRSLDPQFANAGRLEIRVYNGGFYSLVELPNSKLLTLAGIGRITRLNPNGSIDQTFGEAGAIYADPYTYDLGIANDDKIITVSSVADYVQQGVVRYSGVIRRFYQDGEPDIRFASSGSARFDFGNQPGGFGRVQILQDKTLLVTGLSTPENTPKGFVAKIFGKRKL